jgi:hypothetical protein
MTPCIANDSVGTIAPFIFALLLVPLSYMGICLMGFTIGSIGSRRGRIASKKTVTEKWMPQNCGHRNSSG